MRSVPLILVTVLAWASLEVPARAQDPYACIEELREAELDARLAMVDRSLQRGKKIARAWWYGWQITFGGVFAYQLGSALTSDPGIERWANSIGTVGAFLAWMQMYLLPLPAAYSPQRYRRMPSETRAEREAKLRYGLDSIETAAQRETLGRGVMAHGLPILWSTVWGTTLVKKFRGDDPFRISFLIVGGFVITQARIWTLPQHAVDDWEHLRGTVCRPVYGRGEPYPDDPTGGADEELDLDGAEEEADAEPLPGELRAPEPGPSTQVAPFFGGAQLLVTF